MAFVPPTPPPRQWVFSRQLSRCCWNYGNTVGARNLLFAGLSVSRQREGFCWLEVEPLPPFPPLQLHFTGFPSSENGFIVDTGRLVSRSVAGRMEKDISGSFGTIFIFFPNRRCTLTELARNQPTAAASPLFSLLNSQAPALFTATNAFCRRRPPSALQAKPYSASMRMPRRCQGRGSGSASLCSGISLCSSCRRRAAAASLPPGFCCVPAAEAGSGSAPRCQRLPGARGMLRMLLGRGALGVLGPADGGLRPLRPGRDFPAPAPGLR